MRKGQDSLLFFGSLWMPHGKVNDAVTCILYKVSLNPQMYDWSILRNNSVFKNKL